MPRAQILLADDHSFILAGVRSLLEQRFDLVGQVGDGRAAVELALQIRPDIIILDITMPLLNGIDAARQIKKHWPEAKLLFLTMHNSAAYLREAVDAGGTGYVLRSSAKEELLTAIQKLLRGEVYFGGPFDEETLRSAYSAAGASGKPPSILTDRQREVLQLIGEGCGNKEIATILKISVKTVEFHRGRIMNKLGEHTLAGLIRWALKSWVIS